MSLIGPTLDRLFLQGALTVHRLGINVCNTLIPSLQGLLDLVTSVLVKQLTRICLLADIGNAKYSWYNVG